MRNEHHPDFYILRIPPKIIENQTNVKSTLILIYR